MLTYAAIAYSVLAYLIVVLFVLSELSPYTARNFKEVVRLILIILFAPIVLPAALVFAVVAAQDLEVVI